MWLHDCHHQHNIFETNSLLNVQAKFCFKERKMASFKLSNDNRICNFQHAMKNGDFARLSIRARGRGFLIILVIMRLTERHDIDNATNQFLTFFTS